MLISPRAAALALLLLPAAVSLPAAAAQKAGYPNLGSFSQPPDTSAAWYQHCERVEHRQPLARDLPRTPTGIDGKTCKATKLYYDKLNQATTSQAEWDKVRHCALASKDSSVLMMLYANGLGVTQDSDLAVNYACSGDAAPAEMEARVMHLAQLNEINRGRRFDQCDDITSGYMGGYCASIAEGRAGKVRAAFLARLRKGLTAPQTASFDALLKAANAFAEARANDETDMGGSAHAQMAIDAEGREKEWVREYLSAFERGQFKLPAPEQLAAADAELNLAYQRLMALPDEDPDHTGRLSWGTVEKKGVRTTQRAWLAYRGAWIRFAGERYPSIPAASLAAALTERRTRQLALMGG